MVLYPVAYQTLSTWLAEYYLHNNYVYLVNLHKPKLLRFVEVRSIQEEQHPSRQALDKRDYLQQTWWPLIML
jgi:hypothetical protein